VVLKDAQSLRCEDGVLGPSRDGHGKSTFSGAEHEEDCRINVIQYLLLSLNLFRCALRELPCNTGIGEDCRSSPWSSCETLSRCIVFCFSLEWVNYVYLIHLRLASTIG
jgi:hypothetical protein